MTTSDQAKRTLKTLQSLRRLTICEVLRSTSWCSVG